MKVVYSPRFREEWGQLERYIAERASDDVALRFTDRMIDDLETLSSSPERDRLRPEPGADLRVLPFGRRCQIAYRVKGASVSIVALFGPDQRLRLIQDIP